MTTHINYIWQLVKKDTEIQPGFEPGSSEMLLPTEPLELWHWSRGQMVFIRRHSLTHDYIKQQLSNCQSQKQLLRTGS